MKNLTEEDVLHFTKLFQLLYIPNTAGEFFCDVDLEKMKLKLAEQDPNKAYLMGKENGDTFLISCSFYSFLKTDPYMAYWSAVDSKNPLLLREFSSKYKNDYPLSALRAAVESLDDNFVSEFPVEVLLRIIKNPSETLKKTSDKKPEQESELVELYNEQRSINGSAIDDARVALSIAEPVNGFYVGLDAFDYPLAKASLDTLIELNKLEGHRETVYSMFLQINQNPRIERM